MEISLNYYLILGITLFAIGTIGFMVRRNLLVILMCIELMLNAVNLIFVAYAHYLQSTLGLMFVFFNMAVAAAEVSIGLAIIIMIHRHTGAADMDKLNTMKG